MRSCVLVSTLVACTFAFTSRALAQSWSAGRTYPALFEIVALDAVGGDTLWPYAQEDVAADGAQTLEPDEAAVDLRSVYADARATRLWLRAYVASKTAPGGNAVAFFFIDADARTNTGGRADDAQIWPGFEADPPAGGYERALAVRGDGTLFGVFFWDAKKKQWTQQPETPKLAKSEAGVARDPLRVSNDDHGYFQVDLELSVATLTADCTGTIYVRTVNDATGTRRFGDDSGTQAAACHARLDRFGDPEPLHSDKCSSDAQCPAQGQCRDGICLFGYECSNDNTCRTAEKCSASLCVHSVDKTCTQSSDCAGLVCDAGHCVACAGSGARACDDGWLCAPSGACLDAHKSASPAASGSGAHSGGGAGAGTQVRGGSFSCSVRRLGCARSSALLLVPGVCAALLRRKRKRRTRGLGQGGER